MKKLIWIYIRFVQKILINIFLTLTYILVFPLTYVFYMIFTKDKINNKFKICSGYWQKASIYSDEPKDYINQS
jgi:hypothetical protein